MSTNNNNDFTQANLMLQIIFYGQLIVVCWQIHS